MASRADRYTLTDKQEEFYSDFTNNFDLNPITGLLAKVSNEESIKQSLKNIILTNRTERYYNSYIGTRLRNLLFDPMDIVTINAIREEIKETIGNNEPRVKIENIDIKENQDLNYYEVNLYFSIINRPNDVVNLNLILRRVR